MIKCDRSDCQAEATCTPKILIPAKGHPIATHQPITAMIGLRICDKHITDIKVQDFINERFRQAVQLECLLGGRATPDFERAFVQRITLDDPEYIDFMLHALKGKDTANG